MAPLNPLAKFKDGLLIKDGGVPQSAPLKDTAIAVSIEGGLATVVTHRTFTNEESVSIEATLTFPVPVSAVLVALTAKIGDRVLNGRAEAKQAARQTYEDAIEAGKSAVLHEEAIKGIHILTVGHIPPGATIVVESTWVQALSFAGKEPRLRIPTTVGDIFGRSPLIESDELIHAAVTHHATIEIVSSSGTPTIDGVELSSGKADIGLDAPIDITVNGWLGGSSVIGFDGGGRPVEIRVARHPSDDRPLGATIIADRSGSMNQVNSAVAGRHLTKFDMMRKGLAAAARQLSAGDTFALYQFNNQSQRLGGGAGQSLLEHLVHSLQAPSGGTSIGAALEHAIAHEGEGADLLVITDGKSHDIDIQKLARSKVRVHVVLIGEDSLEANVGHLASLTGGQVFIASGDDTSEAIQSALASMRSPHVPPQPLTKWPEAMSFGRQGALIEVVWGEPAADNARDVIGAYASGLVVPLFDEEHATRIAVENGIVSHLTSLVLVDEESSGQDAIPAQRKVPLATPRTSGMMSFAAPMSAMRGIAPSSASLSAGHSKGFDFLEPSSFEVELPLSSRSIFQDHAAQEKAPQIDWDAYPMNLVKTDIMSLPAPARLWIAMTTADQEVAALAAQLGIDKLSLVVALLAFRDRNTNRSAARVLKAILKNVDPAILEPVVLHLNLQVTA